MQCILIRIEMHSKVSFSIPFISRSWNFNAIQCPPSYNLQLDLHETLSLKVFWVADFESGVWLKKLKIAVLV